jgi:cytochrome oxidase assembly protein ShyY1
MPSYSEYISDTPISHNKTVLLVPTQPGETVAVLPENSAEDRRGFRTPDIHVLPENEMVSVGEMKMLSHPTTSSGQTPSQIQHHIMEDKDTNDYLYQFYLGSLSVVGLFILFRFIQKT